MTEDELKKRTKEFGKRGLKLIEELPNTIAGRIVANQFGRSVTSVGAIESEFQLQTGNRRGKAAENAFWLETIIERKCWIRGE